MSQPHVVTTPETKICHLCTRPILKNQSRVMVWEGHVHRWCRNKAQGIIERKKPKNRDKVKHHETHTRPHSKPESVDGPNPQPK